MIFEILVAIALAAVILYVANLYLPPPFKLIVNVVIVLVLVFWFLDVLGVVDVIHRRPVVR